MWVAAGTLAAENCRGRTRGEGGGHHELKGIGSGSVFIGRWSYGAHTRYSWGHSYLLECKTYRALRTAKVMECRSRSLLRIKCTKHITHRTRKIDEKRLERQTKRPLP